MRALNLGLLGSQPSSSGQGVGLLSPEVQQLMGNGLLSERFQPNPNESWSTKLFGSNDPRDPRGPMMNAIAVGLMRGDLASGFEGAGRAYDQVQDRTRRAMAENLAIGKGALEMQSLVNAAQREQKIRAGLQQLAQDDQAAARQEAVAGAVDRIPVDQFGTRGVGGVPLFSLPNMSQSLPGAAPGPAPGSFPPNQIGSSRGNYTQGLSNRFFRQAEVYASNGDFDTANKLYEQAAKFLPEVHKIEVAMYQGQPVNVITMKDGNQVISPFAPTPKVHWADTGGAVVPVDEYRMAPMGNMRKTLTPGEAASNQVAWANVGNARERLAFDRQQATKPTFHEGQWIYPPSSQSPRGAAVSPAGVAPRALTEFQGKSTSYAARMQDASRTLTDLEKAEGGPPAPNQVAQAGYRADFPGWMPGGQILGGIATAANNALNPMVTAAAQKYRQAQENWVAAALRQESGAAIGKDEMDKYIRTFFPQPGDSEAVKKQKAAARKVSERAMLTQAGPGAQQIPAILGGSESSPNASGSPDWRYVDGKLVKVK